MIVASGPLSLDVVSFGGSASMDSMTSAWNFRLRSSAGVGSLADEVADNIENPFHF